MIFQQTGGLCHMSCGKSMNIRLFLNMKKIQRQLGCPSYKNNCVVLFLDKCMGCLFIDLNWKSNF